jgi:hypothetical protein
VHFEVWSVITQHQQSVQSRSRGIWAYVPGSSHILAIATPTRQFALAAALDLVQIMAMSNCGELMGESQDDGRLTAIIHKGHSMVQNEQGAPAANGGAQDKLQKKKSWTKVPPNHLLKVLSIVRCRYIFIYIVFLGGDSAVGDSKSTAAAVHPLRAMLTVCSASFATSRITNGS